MPPLNRNTAAARTYQNASSKVPKTGSPNGPVFGTVFNELERNERSCNLRFHFWDRHAVPKMASSLERICLPTVARLQRSKLENTARTYQNASSKVPKTGPPNGPVFWTVFNELERKKLFFAAWVKSRTERLSVSCTKVTARSQGQVISCKCTTYIQKAASPQRAFLIFFFAHSRSSDEAWSVI